jgi:pimeloyl-ACP methyl ester carboxylesterase
LPNHALYLLHYRGYAGSSGSPSEAANRRDALALFDRARSEHAQVAILGRSLGTGLAVYLASERPVSHLVLITPFDSLEEIAAAHFPFFPVRLLLRDRYDSWRLAPAITAPTTIIAAEHDEVVPLASTERLFTRFAKGLASMKILRGVGHNSISLHPDYIAAVRGAL